MAHTMMFIADDDDGGSCVVSSGSGGRGDGGNGRTGDGGGDKGGGDNGAFNAQAKVETWVEPTDVKFDFDAPLLIQVRSS